MKLLFVLLRLTLVFAGVVLSFDAPRGSVEAQTAPALGPGDRLIGRIANLTGSPTSPDSFSLQLGNSSVDLRVAPNHVVLRPLSGEAEVEGLTNGDFAAVALRRIKHSWVVGRITFDVQPFAPLRQTNGTVVRLSPDGLRLLLRLDSVRVLQIRLTHLTRVRVDGRFTDPQSALIRGGTVQALLLRMSGYWLAIDLDLHTQNPLLRSPV